MSHLAAGDSIQVALAGERQFSVTWAFPPERSSLWRSAIT